MFTDQRAGVRPISFVLNNAGELSAPVILSIRPEELTRTEPSRVAVHQTLGRGMSNQSANQSPVGWVDNFGPGLPSISISGHTGWRTSAASGMDGAQAFEALNTLVMRRYHDAKQAAINSGVDPGLVKLLFIDLLDDIAWSVVPMQFVLKRSKSRPLLFQYQISLQALSTTVETVPVDMPELGSPSNGLLALDRTVTTLQESQSELAGLGDLGADFPSGLLSSATGFLGATVEVFASVQNALGGVDRAAQSQVNGLLAVAGGIASAGLNAFRTINSAANLPANIAARLALVAQGYNELVCLLNNALRPKLVYEQYTGLYGASNCSSTTGGRPASPLAGANVFAALAPAAPLATLTTAASVSTAALAEMDCVLNPMSYDEIGRHFGNVTDGVQL